MVVTLQYFECIWPYGDFLGESGYNWQKAQPLGKTFDLRFLHSTQQPANQK